VAQCSDYVTGLYLKWLHDFEPSLNIPVHHYDHKHSIKDVIKGRNSVPVSWCPIPSICLAACCQRDLIGWLQEYCSITMIDVQGVGDICMILGNQLRNTGLYSCKYMLCSYRRLYGDVTRSAAERSVDIFIEIRSNYDPIMTLGWHRTWQLDSSAARVLKRRISRSSSTEDSDASTDRVGPNLRRLPWQSALFISLYRLWIQVLFVRKRPLVTTLS
jgi:hypothetical protein